MSWRLRCRSPRSIVRFILRFNRFSDFRNGCAFARLFDRVTCDLETHSSSESHPVPLIDACCRSASYETEFQRLVSLLFATAVAGQILHDVGPPGSKCVCSAYEFKRVNGKTRRGQRRPRGVPGRYNGRLLSFLRLIFEVHPPREDNRGEKENHNA